MPLRSMTGVGQVTTPICLDKATGSLELELRSINSRFLECAIKAPLAAAHEQALQRRVSEVLGRGRVELRIHVHLDAEKEASEIDEARLRSLLEDLGSIDRIASAHWMQLAPVNALEILRELRARAKSGASPGVRSGTSEIWGHPELREAIASALTDALNQLVGMREKEGAHLQVQIEQETKALKDCVEQLEARRVAMIPQIQQRIAERVEQLLGGPHGDRCQEVGEARVASELALVLARGDVQEELIRIEAHLHQVRELLAEKASVGQGKRLNFLCQELGREWSTVGSKTPDAACSAVVVAAKSAIERIREQAQNVE